MIGNPLISSENTLGALTVDLIDQAVPLVSFADKETSGTALSWELSAVLLCLMNQSS